MGLGYVYIKANSLIVERIGLVIGELDAEHLECSKETEHLEGSNFIIDFNIDFVSSILKISSIIT
jgi:hypothetical protein